MNQNSKQNNAEDLNQSFKNLIEVIKKCDTESLQEIYEKHKECFVDPSLLQLEIEERLMHVEAMAAMGNAESIELLCDLGLKICNTLKLLSEDFSSGNNTKPSNGESLNPTSENNSHLGRKKTADRVSEKFACNSIMEEFSACAETLAKMPLGEIEEFYKATFELNNKLPLIGESAIGMFTKTRYSNQKDLSNIKEIEFIVHRLLLIKRLPQASKALHELSGKRDYWPMVAWADFNRQKTEIAEYVTHINLGKNLGYIHSSKPGRPTTDSALSLARYIYNKLMEEKTNQKLLHRFHSSHVESFIPVDPLELFDWKSQAGKLPPASCENIKDWIEVSMMFLNECVQEEILRRNKKLREDFALLRNALLIIKLHQDREADCKCDICNDKQITINKQKNLISKLAKKVDGEFEKIVSEKLIGLKIKSKCDIKKHLEKAMLKVFRNINHHQS